MVVAKFGVVVVVVVVIATLLLLVVTELLLEVVVVMAELLAIVVVVVVVAAVSTLAVVTGVDVDVADDAGDRFALPDAPSEALFGENDGELDGGGGGGVTLRF